MGARRDMNEELLAIPKHFELEQGNSSEPQLSVYTIDGIDLLDTVVGRERDD